MNKRIFHIIAAVLGIIIILEGISIVRTFFSSDSSKTEPLKINGQISRSSVTVSVNDTEIPSYEFNSEVYIAAEDLRNFGFIVNSTGNNSVAVDLDEKYFSTPSPGSSNDKSPELPMADPNFKYSDIPDGSIITKCNLSVKGKTGIGYSVNDSHLITPDSLNDISDIAKSENEISITPKLKSTTDSESNIANAADLQKGESNQEKKEIAGTPSTSANTSNTSSGKKIIVLDPGHGKSSSEMSADEKTNAGYVYSSSKGQWGEWRHWKSGTSNVSCEGSGCTGTGSSCWYAIGNGDRDTEPAINLNNALAAKKYLENMGYTVRMTRTTNDENPSFTKRLSYCYPNEDSSQTADAALCVVIHSNAGGSRGSAYIKASGTYDQKGISSTYVSDCNELGSMINKRIASETSLSGNGAIENEGYLIAFNKSPVTLAYMEIGFFDNSNDLSILKSESDKIGLAIAEGINDYLTK